MVCDNGDGPYLRKVTGMFTKGGRFVLDRPIGELHGRQYLRPSRENDIHSDIHLWRKLKETPELALARYRGELERAVGAASASLDRARKALENCPTSLTDMKRLEPKTAV